MNHVQEYLDKFASRSEDTAIVWRGHSHTYRWLLDHAAAWAQQLPGLGISRGDVCVVSGDYSPETCALFFGLMKIGAVLVPLAPGPASRTEGLAKMAGAGSIIEIDESDGWQHRRYESPSANPLVSGFSELNHPGLVVFTSGSSGEPKGILHDCEMVLQKFSIDRPRYSTLLFLLIDHFGGFNTLMAVFAYGGTAVISDNRTPEEICRVIQKEKVELLPVTPTFLNLLLASGCHRDFDLSSVKLISYGTEVMPESTLLRMRDAFPSARLLQTYGLSELGVLRSKSRDSGSLWVQVGGHGFETRVVDGVLHVRSQSAMVGYLNAPSPFDEDGWMNTGDRVEVDGDYMRILGRESDVINVGGEKVFPAEVETVLLAADNVAEATVYGVPNAIMGKIPAAYLTLHHEEDAIALKSRLRKHCLSTLKPFKVPMTFTIVPLSEHYSDRIKKSRPESLN